MLPEASLWNEFTLWNELTAVMHITVACLLSIVVGAEREYFAKAAGIRTYTVVGLGSALFTVVSIYGFMPFSQADGMNYDGARVAAQIVSGVGFLGAGLIFVRRDVVRGLTTAASVWFVAAIGMAAGAGQYIVATAATLIYLLVAFGVRPISARMPQAKSTHEVFNITYWDGQGVLRKVMEIIAEHGITVTDLKIGKRTKIKNEGAMQEVKISTHGASKSLEDLVQELADAKGVIEVIAKDPSRY